MTAICWGESGSLGGSRVQSTDTDIDRILVRNVFPSIFVAENLSRYRLCGLLDTARQCCVTIAWSARRRDLSISSSSARRIERTGVRVGRVQVCNHGDLKQTTQCHRLAWTIQKGRELCQVSGRRDDIELVPQPLSQRRLLV